MMPSRNERGRTAWVTFLMGEIVTSLSGTDKND